MADVKKIATRESYGNALVALGEKYDNLVVLDADLAEATKTGIFKKAFPERHIDCGIAESNMVGIAAGLASTGKVPFCSSFAMFAAGRAFEQVRNSVGYPHLNVKIGATHAGISVGEDGASHQCNEDIALMRTIPGMTIINPSDDVEAKAAVEAAYKMDGPVYLRFGRLAVPVINDRPDYKFEIGKGVVLKEGKDLTIIATGLEVNESLEAAKKLAEDGIDKHSHNQAYRFRYYRKECSKDRQGGYSRRTFDYRWSWWSSCRGSFRAVPNKDASYRRKGHIWRIRSSCKAS